ncbi:YoaK family protein [Saccharopolyspora sp. 5N708]|uniref:YoaK family protein n=1 Tax=Saccharopolyspora sp. 5N708 TaxID=3457424 RepID=UPI003FD60E18
MDVVHSPVAGSDGAESDAETDRQTARGQRTAVVVRNRLLVGLSLSTGAVDAICYLALGKVFAAFMTGNVVFLGLAAVSSLGSNASLGPDAGRVVVAMLGFAVGVLFSAKLIAPSRRAGAEWSHRVSIALATVAAAEVAFLAIWLAVSDQPSTVLGDVLIGIFAVAMGIQMDAVRSLGVPEVSTTAATATIVSFVNQLAHWRSASADRWLYLRIGAAMVVGALVDGLLLLYARPYAPIVPVVATVAVLVVASVALRPAR